MASCVQGRSKACMDNSVRCAMARDRALSCVAGALNLTQYSGLYGGKWCYSIFDPPPPAGTDRAV